VYFLVFGAPLMAAAVAIAAMREAGTTSAAQ
jgi:hypothetical protein